MFTQSALMRVGMSMAAGMALAATMAGTAIAADLSDDAKSALHAALEDEYHAEAVYEAVIDTFGQVRPFSNVVMSERQHQSMLVDLYEQYDLKVPENPYANGTKSIGEMPGSLTEACQISVAAEVANRGLYVDDLLPKVAAYPDITQVMTILSDASQYRHLPAFERCAR